MRAWWVIWTVAAILGGGAGAADERAVYDLSIRGFKVGVLTLAAEETSNAYSLAGRITNTGLTRVMRRFSYEGRAVGRVAGRRLLPERYEEAADTGKRSSEVAMVYRRGVPEVLRYTSPGEVGADAPSAESQAGTLDPLSAVYALLRDAPRAEACQLDVRLFDGRRQSRIAMAPAGETEGLPLCVGRYERLKGFTAEEVARHRQFDFTLRYIALAGGTLRVQEVVFQSLYGRAVIQRR